ncbi:MAG: DUF4920 domain-containing protein [Flavobacteriales bacterium]|nr:DUF4920 domain-containing protein [Flavobacteriales bacterium]
MKKLLFIAAAALLYACGGGHEGHDHAGHDHGDHDHAEETVATPVNMYGAEFDTTGAQPINSLTSMLADNGTADGVFAARIVESCQKMGCWMKIESPAEGEMMVFMNDHEFFVPKTGVSGLDCYITGSAYYDTVSVDFQKHLLEDANAAQEEIDAITEPKFEMAFNATGVVIKGYEGSEEEMEEGHDHDHDHEGDDHDHDHAEEMETTEG